MRCGGFEAVAQRPFVRELLNSGDSGSQHGFIYSHRLKVGLLICVFRLADNLVFVSYLPKALECLESWYIFRESLFVRISTAQEDADIFLQRSMHNLESVANYAYWYLTKLCFIRFSVDSFPYKCSRLYSMRLPRQYGMYR